MEIQLLVEILGFIKNRISSDIEYPSRHILAAMIEDSDGDLYIVPIATGVNCVPPFLSKITP